MEGEENSIGTVSAVVKKNSDDTSIPMSKVCRARLKAYASANGVSYEKAINKLLDEVAPKV